MNHLSTVAVVDEAVGGASSSAGNLVELGEGNDAAGDGRGGGKSLESDQVESKTSNVGSGHGGTRDGVGSGGGANPGREDAGAWGKDVEDSTVVGVGGTGTVGGDGTNGDGIRSRCRRVVGSVGIVVTGSDDAEDTLAVGRGNGGVEGSRVATA